MSLTCFLPKDLDLRSKCRESLTPSSGSAAVAAMGSHGRKVAGIQFREKRLAMEIWKCNGIHQKGSHFPICVFTNNVGRRSPEKLEQRKQRHLQRRQWERECRNRNSPSVAQAQERPAHAVQHAGPSWSAQAQGGFRHGHCTSGYQTYSQASSEPWILGWQASSEPWILTMGPAVAADGEKSQWESHLFTQLDALATRHDGTFGFGAAREGRTMRVVVQLRR